MKILQINAVNGILSTGRTTLELANELKRLGHRSFIAYSEGEAYGAHNYKIGCYLDKKLHALCSRAFGLQGYYSFFATRCFIKYMKLIKPDIVHLRNLHSNYINLNMLLDYLSKNNIATVITLHDCWFYTGRCTNYTTNQCYQWKKGCYKCPNNNNTMVSWFFDRSNKMWWDKNIRFHKIKKLAVIGVSDWVTGEARNSFLSDATILKRIYNWIDLDVFKPTDQSEMRHKLNIINKFVIIGVAAQWNEAKGLSEFMKLSKHLDEDIIILLVGNMDQKSKLPDNIISIPQTSSKIELASYYSMSDVLVSLSREETFGKAIAEAISCGTPAIVYHSTACPELIGDQCGYVAANNTLNEILKGIHQVKHNGKTYYSAGCRKHAVKNFDMKKNVKEYIEVYHELLNYDNKKIPDESIQS